MFTLKHEGLSSSLVKSSPQRHSQNDGPKFLAVQRINPIASLFPILD